MTLRNYIIALVMALLALVQAVSGFVLWLALPPRRPRRHFLVFERRLAHYAQSGGNCPDGYRLNTHYPALELDSAPDQVVLQPKMMRSSCKS
jgi:hypothetical protein